MSWGDLSAMNTGAQSELKRLLEERIAAQQRAQQLAQQQFQNERLLKGDALDQQRADQNGESIRLQRELQAATQQAAQANTVRDDMRTAIGNITPDSFINGGTRDAAVQSGAEVPERFARFDVPKMAPSSYVSPEAQAADAGKPVGYFLGATPQQREKQASDKRLADKDKADADRGDRQAAAAELNAKASMYRSMHPTQGAAGVGASLTEDGLNLAADQYSQTGQMPPMGMGNSAARSAIINRAAERHPGSSIAQAQVGFGADKGSLASMQKMRDAVGAFEKTASDNANVMMQSAKNLTDTGSPWMNTPWREVERQAKGDPNVAAFAAARRVVVNEYARIVSNPNLTGVLSDSARQEMDDVLTGNATIPQMMAVLKVLRADASNRRTSLDAGLAEINGRLGGRGGTPSPVTETPDADWQEVMPGVRARKVR